MDHLVQEVIILIGASLNLIIITRYQESFPQMPSYRFLPQGKDWNVYRAWFQSRGMPAMDIRPSKWDIHQFEISAILVCIPWRADKIKGVSSTFNIHYIYVLISGQGYGTLGIFVPLSGMEIFSNLTMKSRCDQRGLINVRHIAQNDKKSWDCDTILNLPKPTENISNLNIFLHTIVI